MGTGRADEEEGVVERVVVEGVEVEGVEEVTVVVVVVVVGGEETLALGVFSSSCDSWCSEAWLWDGMAGCESLFQRVAGVNVRGEVCWGFGWVWAVARDRVAIRGGLFVGKLRDLSVLGGIFEDFLRKGRREWRSPGGGKTRKKGNSQYEAKGQGRGRGGRKQECWKGGGGGKEEGAGLNRA